MSIKVMWTEKLWEPVILRFSFEVRRTFQIPFKIPIFFEKP